MLEQLDDIQANYFVICDQVITDSTTNKQSLIGIYSTIAAAQLPLQTNMAVALCLRVHSARERRLRMRFTDPDGQVLFDTVLPCDWNPLNQGLAHSSFATVQMGVNLQSVPLAKPGVYMVALYSDDMPVASYLLSVVAQAPQQQPTMTN